MNRLFTYMRLVLLLFILQCSFIGYAQNIFKVSGIVTGIDNKPISNVAVSVEGVSDDPVITGETGTFTLEVPDKNIWMLIRPVGNYKPQRIFLNGRDSITIFLVTEDRRSGYDKVAKPIKDEIRRDLSGFAFSLDLENVSKLPYQTIDQYFQGRVPGMLTTNHSGTAGYGTYSYMRGMRSMIAGNQPLIIVDGMPYENHGLLQSNVPGYVYNPFVSIVNEDIVELTVINDITLTSIYGSKASNGIIWIQTLKPTQTKTTIDVSLKAGVNLSQSELPVLDNMQFRTLAHEILMTSSINEETFRKDYPGLYDDKSSNDFYRYNHNTNWQDEVFRHSTMKDFYMSVKGGDEIAKYGLSFGFAKNEGIIKASDYSRISLRFVGTFRIFKWMQLHASNNLVYGSFNLMESGPVEYSNPILASLKKSPFMYPYQFDKDGNELSFLDGIDNFGISNPVGIISGVIADNSNYRFVGTYNINIDISDHLKLKSVVGYNLNSSIEGFFLPSTGMVEYNNGLAYNISNRQANYLKAFYNDNRLSDERTFSRVHSLYSFMGFRINTNRFEQDRGIAKNTPSDDYRSLIFGESTLAEISGAFSTWNAMVFYGGVNYSLKDKYFLGAHFSVDGSSRTGKDAESNLMLFDTPFGLFPSFSAAWRVSNENFLKNLSWLSNLKLRTTFGYCGNDNIGNYSSRVYYSQLYFRETTGIILGSRPNTSLTFETYQMFNAGLDFSAFGERIIMSLNYFNNLSKDLVSFEKQSEFMGYDYRLVNGATATNEGIELVLNSRLIESKKFNVDLGINFANVTNTLNSIVGGSQITMIEAGEIISQAGETMFSFYGLKTDGVFATHEEASDAGLTNHRGIPFKAGDMRFLDLSGPDGTPDQVIDDFDKTIIGDPFPDYYGGVSLEIKYGRFSLYNLLQFVVGNEVFNYTRYQTEKMNDLSNQTTSVLNRWTYEGQETNMPRALYEDPVGNSAFSDRWIEDGSYIRLKNVILSYAIPEGIWAIRDVDFYISVNNLFTFSRYLGYDPEVSYSSSSVQQGVDYAQSPMFRSFVIGVKFGL